MSKKRNPGTSGPSPDAFAAPERRSGKRALFAFERRGERLLGRKAFAGRLGWSLTVVAGLVGLSLLGGMVGYRWFEGMPWIDAFANAAMILSGMGPLCELKTAGGKLFAGGYALFSGLAFILAAGLLLAPMLHRTLHRFHLDEGDWE